MNITTTINIIYNKVYGKRSHFTMLRKERYVKICEIHEGQKWR